MKFKTLIYSILLSFALLLAPACSEESKDDSKNNQNGSGSESSSDSSTNSDSSTEDSLTSDQLSLLNTNVNDYVCEKLTDQLQTAIDAYKASGQTDDQKCAHLADISDIGFAIIQNDNPSEEDECDLPETPDLQAASDEMDEQSDYIDCTPDTSDAEDDPENYATALEVINEVCDDLTQRLSGLVDIYVKSDDEETQCQALSRMQSIGFWMSTQDDPSVTTECDYDGNEDLAAIKTRMDAAGYIDCTPDIAEG